MKEMLRANAKSWRWSGTSSVSSQQQAAGDHVQRAPSRNPQQQKQPQHPQHQQQGQERLVLWIRANPNGVMNRWVDKHYAMDLMQENCDDCEAVLESTSETSDEEDTYERPGENIRITSAERLRCTEPTTNLYTTSRSLTTTPARIRAPVSCCLMARPAHGEGSECGPRQDFCFSNGECRSQLGRKAGPR